MAKTLLTSFITAVLGWAKAEVKNSSSTKPHIVFLLADDLGWNDVGYHRHPGDKEIVTPNIDNLVQEGIELNRHYTYYYCTPSRSALQSGRLPVHVIWGFGNPLRVNLSDPITGMSGIPRNMTGIAEKLREGGYRTHITGKWDAGMAYWEQTPMGRGYETFFGYYHHATDFYSHIQYNAVGKSDLCGNLVDLWNTTGPARNCNGTYMEELFTENTMGVLDRHDPYEPLFLVHAFHIAHDPLQVPKHWEQLFAWIDNDVRRKYVAMVNYMDDVVGLIVAKLKSKMMWENSLVILCSDNGGPTYESVGANNRPLKGGKLSNWEGGIRVNALASGGVIPSSKRGTKLDDYIHMADWYATFCAIAGVDVHDQKAQAAGLPPVDGIDQSALLLKSLEEAPPGSGQRTEIHHSVRALTRGRWKLVSGGEFTPHGRNESAALGEPIAYFDDYLTGYEDHYPPFNTRIVLCGSGCLYDIQDDPIEENNLATERPDILQAMFERLAELNANNLFVNRGQASRDGCARWPGFYGPWLATEGHGLEDNFNFV